MLLPNQQPQTFFRLSYRTGAVLLSIALATASCSKDNNENDEYNEGDEEINDCGEDLSSIQ